MPKIDPDDADTSATTTAPAPLPAGQTSSTAAPSLFGAATPTSGATSNGFGSSTPTTGASTFGSTSTSGFGSSSSTGAGAFGSSAGGFGSTSSGGFGASTGGFGGGMSSGMGGGMGGQMNNGMASAETANAFGAAMAASAGHEPEHWMKSFWRPAMGWLYMLICFMDFCVFPMLSMFLPIIEKGFGLQMGYTAWQSLTLSNGGLIHLAFGAILGVSAYGRTQEKKTGTS